MPRLGDGLGALVGGWGFASTVRLAPTAVPTPGHFCPNGRALLSHHHRLNRRRFTRALLVSRPGAATGAAPPWRLFRGATPPWRAFSAFQGVYRATVVRRDRHRATVVHDTGPGPSATSSVTYLMQPGHAGAGFGMGLGRVGPGNPCQTALRYGFCHQMPANPCHRGLWHGRATLVRRFRQSVGTVLPDGSSTLGARRTDGTSPLLLTGGTRGAPTLMGGSGRPMARLADSVTCGACERTA